MPTEIDALQRLDEIAWATLEVAREGGSGAVTLRAVATRMGRSTTIITNYLPTRADLLSNAITYMRRHWDAEVGKVLDGRTGVDRLRALVDWTFDTEELDDPIRRLWNETLAKEAPGSERYQSMQEEAREEHEIISSTVEDSLATAPSWLADLVFLAARGYYTSSIEDPEEWPGQRARAAVNGMLDDLLSVRLLTTER